MVYRQGIERDMGVSVLYGDIAREQLQVACGDKECEG